MLDSRESTKALDQKDMFASIEAMPKHLTEGLRRGHMSGLPRFSPKDIVVCGIGGSAIGGDLLCGWLQTSSEIPCCVSRSYDVPTHMGKDTLAIVASYSGNTEETLRMFDEARKRRAKIVAISSGGQLAEMSQSYTVPFARLPSGMMPRATVGYMFGAMLGILERSCITAPEKQIQETLRVLNKMVSYCKQSVPTGDNPSKILAHELFPHIPVIIGYGITSPVARRWANQMNENGKVLAFSSELPEMNHNEIVGWMKDARSKGFAAVFLEHGKGQAAMDRRLSVTKEMIGRASQVYSAEAIGLSPMAKMFSLVIMGDFVSAYTGILKHEDPSSNEPIDELKRVLSKK